MKKGLIDFDDNKHHMKMRIYMVIHIIFLVSHMKALEVLNCAIYLCKDQMKRNQSKQSLYYILIK